MLMDQPQGAETPTAPAGRQRSRARARWAIMPWRGWPAPTAPALSRRANWLRGHGLAAPEIHAVDAAHGFVILEDLGDDLFADVLADGGDETALYQAAVEVLAQHPRPGRARCAVAADKPLFAYDDTALMAETDLLTEWFAAAGAGPRGDAMPKSQSIAPCGARRWTGIGGGRRVFVHRDYHAQNLLWLPERDGVARVGLIDFQDAVAGSAAYDLISLTEDARRDVPPGHRASRHGALSGRHGGAGHAAWTKPPSAARWRSWRPSATPRSWASSPACIKRDGKPRYLDLLPRVWGYLERDLRASGAGRPARLV